jgi:hypothetical protein
MRDQAQAMREAEQARAEAIREARRAKDEGRTVEIEVFPNEAERDVMQQIDRLERRLGKLRRSIERLNRRGKQVEIIVD